MISIKCETGFTPADLDSAIFVCKRKYSPIRDIPVEMEGAGNSIVEVKANHLGLILVLGSV